MLFLQGIYQGSALWHGMSAPFQGASGASGATVYGQRGCAGSGGGGCYATQPLPMVEQAETGLYYFSSEFRA